MEDQKIAADQAAQANQAAVESAQRASDAARQAMESVYDSISSALKSLMGQSDEFNSMQRKQAKITLQSALAVAKAGGSLVGFAGLDSALAAIENIDKESFSSAFDYQREFGQSVGLLDQLNNTRGSHTNGLASVPFDGYMARLHKGEQVVTARESESGGVVGGEVAALRNDVRAIMIPLLEETIRMRKRQDQWDGDGLPEVRAVA